MSSKKNTSSSSFEDDDDEDYRRALAESEKEARREANMIRIAQQRSLSDVQRTTSDATRRMLLMQQQQNIIANAKQDDADDDVDDKLLTIQRVKQRRQENAKDVRFSTDRISQLTGRVQPPPSIIKLAPAVAFDATESSASSTTSTLSPISTRVIRTSSPSSSSTSSQSSTADNKESIMIPRSKWASPTEMNATYAFFYNTINKLHVLLEPGVWKAIYDVAPHRPRNMNWTNATPQQLAYKTLHAKENANKKKIIVKQVFGEDEFDVEKDDNGFVQFDTSLSVNRPRTIKKSEPKVMVPAVIGDDIERAESTYSKRSRRFFELQREKLLHLCATHSLNNVANAVVFCPADQYSAIDAVRNVTLNKYSQLEEVTLQALREGIFLLPIRLTSLRDTVPLSEREQHPKNKLTLEMLKRAGGMVIYQPPNHYQALVYNNDSDVEPAMRWVIFSTNSAVASGETAQIAINNFIAARSQVGSVSMRQDTKRIRSGGGDIYNQFFGLLPVSLEMLTRENSEKFVRTTKLADDSLITIALLRTLVRRSLGDMIIKESAFSQEEGALFDIHMTRPISPCCIDMIGRDVGINLVSGLELTNAATFYAIRFQIDEALNNHFDDLASVVLQMNALNWTANLAGYRDAILKPLTLLRGVTITSEYCGMLFANVDANSDNDTMRKFTAMHSNRRWFRFLMLHVAIGAMKEYLEDKKNAVDREIVKILCFMCLVGYTDLSTTGVKSSAYPFTVSLIARVYNDRKKLIPTLVLQEVAKSATVRTMADLDPKRNYMVTHFLEGETLEDGTTEFTAYLALNRYEKTLYLADAMVDSGRFDNNWPFPSLEPFRHTPATKEKAIDRELDYERNLAFKSGKQRDTPFNAENFRALKYDNVMREYDSLAEFVSILRETLFVLPFGGTETSALPPEADASPANQVIPRLLALHYVYAANKFVDECVDFHKRSKYTFTGVDSRWTAMKWIDHLAYTSLFATDSWQKTNNTIPFRDVSTQQPRIVERASQLGFKEVHQVVFGTLTTTADNRPAPSKDNTRIPVYDSVLEEPKWTEVSPHTGVAAHLSVGRIADLPRLV